MASFPREKLDDYRVRIYIIMYTYLNISISLRSEDVCIEARSRRYVVVSARGRSAYRSLTPYEYIDIERRHQKLDSALNITKINRRRVARQIIAPIDKFTHRRNEREYKKLWKIVRISQAAGGAGRPRGK